jgi:hypothetical protein
MQFKEWLTLTENSGRTYAKVGLYSPIDDILGQYPPLWGISKAADLITYYNINYPNGMPSKDGIMSTHRELKETNGNPSNLQKAANNHDSQRYIKYELPPE